MISIATIGESSNDDPFQENHLPQPLGRGLTNRELQILAYCARGFTEKEVAIRLEISPNTVRVHLENVKRKMGARNKVHAVALAISENLIKPISHTSPPKI
jgi:DNA-binding CsgD family transcriptional regulator